MSESEQQIQENDFFIGRRMVMFEAIKDYNGQSHAGQTDEQKLDALTLAVDKAAVNNAFLTEGEKAKVALEWKESIRGHDAKDVLGFVNDVKPITDKETPKLTPKSNYGTDLRTAGINNPDSLIAIAQHTTPQVQADLQELAEMNKGFAAAAEKNNLILYSEGKNLTEKFDALDKDLEKTPEKIAEQQKRLDQLKQEMQQEAAKSQAAAPPQEERGQGEDQQQGGGLLGMLGGLLGGLGSGIGMIFAVIIGALMSAGKGIGNFLGGMFGGGDRQQQGGANANLTPETTAHRAGVALKKDKDLVNGDGKFTREDFVDDERIKKGKIEYIAGKLDLDGNHKISAEEWNAAADRVEKGMEVAAKKKGKGEIDEKGTEELKSAMADFRDVLIGFGKEAAKTDTADHGLHAKNDKTAAKETSRGAG